MTAQYTELEIGIYRKGVHNAQSVNAGLLLNAFLKTGNIAQYPTKSRIGACCRQLQDWEVDVAVAAVNDCLDKILAKIHASPYIGREMKRVLTRGIFRVDDLTVVGFLILSLPNLRSITIQIILRPRSLEATGFKRR